LHLEDHWNVTSYVVHKLQGQDNQKLDIWQTSIYYKRQGSFISEMHILIELFIRLLAFICCNFVVQAPVRETLPLSL